MFTRKIIFWIVLVLPLAAQSPAASSTPDTGKTQVVMLGTGTPLADPQRSGPSVAIVVNGSAYLVDCGPGVVRRASAVNRKGVKALAVENLKMVFITHLHSDHTVGLPDLIFSPWVLGRTQPLKVFGPAGTRAMTEHILKAWVQDVDIRLHGGEPSNKTGYKAQAVDAKPGVVYKDENVTVRAFLVKHGAWEQAFGYRFETKDRSIVISGDTTYTPAIVKACHGCDVLLQEVYSEPGLKKDEPDWQNYHSHFHTASGDLARIATAAKPGLLVLYHQLFMGTSEEDLVKEVQAGYSGKVVSAHDLDVY